MSDSAQPDDQFRRYAALIRDQLVEAGDFSPQSESATAIQVERGIIFPLALQNRSRQFDAIERLIEVANRDRLNLIAVVDRGGHHRPVYRGLLVYSCLQTFGLIYETLPREQFGRWEEGLRAWCDLLEAELGETEWPIPPVPAERGSNASESAWMALALHIAGKIYVRDAWTDLASDIFGRIARSQTDAGAFLHATPSDNPETHWYHELVLLHAAASYAVQSEDRTIATAVARNAQFHLEQTQPDHATNQPWALFAFIWNPLT
ncbi:MAG TPA: hypothetical protein VKK61_00505, partial [Tepidisphaeraceae bacterium]|nr:hypothetical protein [Tepidisphaeraceae bacterium]